MHRVIGSILLLFLALVTADGQDVVKGTSTVTFGVGGGWAVDSSLGLSGGPQFNGTYEFRLLKYMALEAGVDTTVSSIPFSRAYYGIYGRSETVPFGFRGILPLRHGRLELFGGARGAYLEDFQRYDGMGIQFNLGARVAVDKHNHFWLGSTGHFVQNFGISQGEWFTWTADLGFRFGRRVRSGDCPEQTAGGAHHQPGYRS